MGEGSRRTVVDRVAVMLLVVALGFAAGCARQATAPPRVGAVATASAAGGALSLTLELPAAQLKAASEQTATVILANRSQAATQIVTPVFELRLVDVAGGPVVDWPPPRHMPFPGYTRLAPGARLERALRLRVPAPGRYRLEVRNVAAPVPPSSISVAFESVP